MGSTQESRGFTLIELMIVISIILILVSISMPIYTKSIIHAKEAVLRDDLFTMRSAIDQYTLDKQKAPQSLQDLVTAGYLRRSPRIRSPIRPTPGRRPGRHAADHRPEPAGNHRRALRSNRRAPTVRRTARGELLVFEFKFPIERL